MLGNHWRWNPVKTVFPWLLGVVILLGGLGCSDRGTATETTSSQSSPTRRRVKIEEVSPPASIQQLRQDLEIYQPQVKILNPPPDTTLQDNRLEVRFQVRDLPIYKDDTLGMGPHLHVILDNQPYIAVYDIDRPLILEDLSPGTHTLRAFASRPWHESFKNEGAYDQTTFHVFTETPYNSPDPDLPLLTYSRPKGKYGAEPIMLDFYLTGAPLHLVARESSEDEITDWRIRCTVNGQTFVTEQWQPIYLTGFQPGKNWIEIEFLDEQGDPIVDAFNTTARLITYEPGGRDTLSKLVRGDLSAEDARSIVNPDYQPPTSGKAEPTPIPTPEANEPPKPEPTPSPTPTPAEPEAESKPAEGETVEPEPSESEPSEQSEASEVATPTSEPTESPTPESQSSEPAEEEAESVAPTSEPAESESRQPEPQEDSEAATPTSEPDESLTLEPQPSEPPETEESSQSQPTEPARSSNDQESETTQPSQSEKRGGFFRRFRRSPRAEPEGSEASAQPSVEPSPNEPDTELKSESDSASKAASQSEPTSDSDAEVEPTSQSSTEPTSEASETAETDRSQVSEADASEVASEQEAPMP